MNIKHTRDAYGVPARIGGRVEYTDSMGTFRGTIVGARCGYLLVHFDDFAATRALHPTWNLVYLDTAFLVRLSNKPPCWVSGVGMRTTRKESARQFASKAAAQRALNRERESREWPNASIVEILL